MFIQHYFPTFDFLCVRRSNFPVQQKLVMFAQHTYFYVCVRVLLVIYCFFLAWSDLGTGAEFFRNSSSPARHGRDATGCPRRPPIWYPKFSGNDGNKQGKAPNPPLKSGCLTDGCGTRLLDVFFQEASVAFLLFHFASYWFAMKRCRNAYDLCLCVLWMICIFSYGAFGFWICNVILQMCVHIWHCCNYVHTS